LDDSLEGLLDIQPAVFDMFQAFFRGHDSLASPVWLL
jgi:hypothetical protein